MQISLNPISTQNAAGTFNTTSDGYIQGVYLDDPALRNELAARSARVAALYDRQP